MNYNNYYTQKVSLTLLVTDYDTWTDHHEYADLEIGVLAENEQRAKQLIQAFNLNSLIRGLVDRATYGELELQDGGYDEPEGVDSVEGDYLANTGDRDDNYGIQWYRTIDINQQYL